MTSVISSVLLCPINFKEFGKLNRKLDNIEASLLFSKLKFHSKNSKIKKNGQTCIARSREQIAEWFDFSVKKIDRLLSFLESKGLINKKAGLWFGKKKLFISTTEEFGQIPINLKILDILIEQIGSLKGALIFSKIAFSFANSKIIHNNLTWCCIKKKDLSSWSGFSIRTIDSLIQDLVRTGLILKKNFIYQEKAQTHYHIPTFVIELIHKKISNENKNQNSPITVAIKPGKRQIEPTQVTEISPALASSALNSTEEKHVIKNVENSHICRELPAKMTVSIKISSNQKQANNNTNNEKLLTKKENKKSDIIFNHIGNELTQRQTKYLKGALENTINRKKLNISSPSELWEQLRFTILNEQQHRGIQSFTHAVSRCMKILSDGNWKTPIGFYNHSVKGAEIKKINEKHIDEWQKLKEFDCKRAKEFCNKIGRVGEFYNSTNKNILYLTDKAMELVKQLVYLTKSDTHANRSASIDELIKNLSTQIEGYIRLGADKDRIRAYFNNLIEITRIKANS